nr:hypothetical protein Iba_chr08fCG2760 [Ipomoea batatas]
MGRAKASFSSGNIRPKNPDIFGSAKPICENLGFSVKFCIINIVLNRFQRYAFEANESGAVEIYNEEIDQIKNEFTQGQFASIVRQEIYKDDGSLWFTGSRLRRQNAARVNSSTPVHHGAFRISLIVAFDAMHELITFLSFVTLRCIRRNTDQTQGLPMPATKAMVSSDMRAEPRLRGLE